MTDQYQLFLSDQQKEWLDAYMAAYADAAKTLLGNVHNVTNQERVDIAEVAMSEAGEVVPHVRDAVDHVKAHRVRFDAPLDTFELMGVRALQRIGGFWSNYVEKVPSQGSLPLYANGKANGARAFTLTNGGLKQVANGNAQVRAMQRKGPFEQTAKGRYFALAGKYDYLPSDYVLADLVGCTRGAFPPARSALRLKGYEFEQTEYGWKVIKRPVRVEELRKQAVDVVAAQVANLDADAINRLLTALKGN